MNILHNKARNQLHGYIDYFAVKMKAKKKRIDFILGCIPPQKNH